MAKWFVLCIAAIGIVSCKTSKPSTASEPELNTLTKKETKEGWKLLFDGTTKNGWHVFNNRTDGSSWKVVDGTLFFDPSARKSGDQGGGDLVTDQEYENYHLSLEWKLDSGGNCGIIFQSKEDPKYKYSWVTGPEMQILDNDRHPDAKIIKHRSGDLYDLISSSVENVKPVGQWNKSEIIVNNAKLELWQNGKMVVSTTEWDSNWKNMIANSKFKSMSDFGTYRKGKIALQDHGNPVWFRNIKIKVI
jgi:hypothetical protein